MKLVINKCYGGFGLSARAVKRLAELQGRPCYFFTHAREDGHLVLGKYVSVSVEAADGEFMFSAFDIPNPNEFLVNTDKWCDMTMEERRAANELHSLHAIESGRDVKRDDPALVQVVEELGDSASAKLADLRIVEIPDGTEYEIDEYDGVETIHEVHASWG